LMDIWREDAYVTAVRAAKAGARASFQETISMKRRSARPFTVEVKNNRTSIASLTPATARLRSGQTLQSDWASFVAAGEPAAQVSQPAQEVSSHQPQVKAPVRRVLPSLVPIFEPPTKPEPQVEAAEPKLPRVRRPRAKAEPSLSASESSSAQTAPGPPVIGFPVASKAAPAAADLPAAASRAEALPTRPKRAPRGGIGLSRGERWKRRLPRILR
jgi:hypothetical protein